jgi:hypothetical protein
MHKQGAPAACEDGHQKTLTAHVQGQYREFLQILSPPISYFREYSAAAHARSPAAVDSLRVPRESSTTLLAKRTLGSLTFYRNRMRQFQNVNVMVVAVATG